MIIITDILVRPIDEGAKVATFNLLNILKQEYKAIIFSINGDADIALADRHYTLNKLLLNLAFYMEIRQHSDPTILYIPEAAATLASFVRARLLAMFTGKMVHILSMQPRIYGKATRFIIKSLRPASVITPSQISVSKLKELGITALPLPLGVDDQKYRPYDAARKHELRQEYNIPEGSIVLLHVGHIRESRNLRILLEVKKGLPAVLPIVVGSTYSPLDAGLSRELEEKGIRVIRKFIPNMADMYNLADYYIFPVIKDDAAIATPLSVLEAMACGLPVITTRFGSLPEVFPENLGFRFFITQQEIIQYITEGLEGTGNREKVLPYTWKAIAKKICDQLGER